MTKKWPVESQKVWVIARTDELAGSEGDPILTNADSVETVDTRAGKGAPVFTQVELARAYMRSGSFAHLVEPIPLEGAPCVAGTLMGLDDFNNVRVVIRDPTYGHEEDAELIPIKELIRRYTEYLDHWRSKDSQNAVASESAKGDIHDFLMMNIPFCALSRASRAGHPRQASDVIANVVFGPS